MGTRRLTIRSGMASALSDALPSLIQGLTVLVVGPFFLFCRRPRSQRVDLKSFLPVQTLSALAQEPWRFADC